ncbi:hypothetical protein JOQ06_027019, partial [Pogonophryne albipinna]
EDVNSETGQMYPRDEGRRQRESTVVAWNGDRQVATERRWRASACFIFPSS